MKSELELHKDANELAKESFKACCESIKMSYKMCKNEVKKRENYDTATTQVFKTNSVTCFVSKPMKAMTVSQSCISIAQRLKPNPLEIMKI